MNTLANHDFSDVTSERLLSETEEYGACRIWLGRVDDMGRPAFYHRGKTLLAQSLIAALHENKKKLPKSVDRTCANARCMAPEHIRAKNAYTPRLANLRIGVPLPAHTTLKDSGYIKVCPKYGEPIWEPPDIAAAVLSVLQPARKCLACQTPIEGFVRFYCSRDCGVQYASQRARDSKRRYARAGAETNERPCGHCSQPLNGLRQVYCNKHCAAMARQAVARLASGVPNI